MSYAGVGLRFVALVIDGIALMVVGYVLALLLGGTTGEGFALSGGPAFLWFAIVALYLVGMDATAGGTLGKKILGLRVVRADGTPMTWSAALVRNVLRIVDGLFLYLVGAILIWTSPQKQRLGDRVAGTVVVRGRAAAVPVQAS